MGFGKQMAGVCLLIVCGATSSEAGFRDNFSQWNELDSYGRYLYVQGVFDRMTGYFFSDEPEWVVAQRNGYTKCALDLKLNPKMLAEAVTKHYEDHPDDWGFAPHFVFSNVVTRVCLRYINDERSKYSLDPWPPHSGSISSQTK